MNITVKDLIEALTRLPEDAIVYESTYCSDAPLNMKHGTPLFVYEKDKDVRLYIDDGEASHPDIDPYRICLFKYTRKP